MVEKQIEFLNKQIENLDDKEFDLDGWKSSTKVILSRVFGENNQGIMAIDNIKFDSGGLAIGDASHFWDKMDSCKKQGKDILEACITELGIFGQPEFKETSKSGININLTQYSNQTVNVKLLISALEDQLTVSQLREVNEIMKAEKPKSDKKRSIIESLKRFGSDVSSNIVANILTNPDIWG